MKVKLLLAVVLLLGVSAAASAQTIGDRARHERERIYDGRRNGDLTRGEEFRLNQEQRNIDHDLFRARRDGYISPRERRHILREERRANRRIYFYRHNRDHRYSY